jgi:hypothetical protein
MLRGFRTRRAKKNALKGALKLANEIRGEKELPLLKALPQGVRSNNRLCPLARATGMVVNTREIHNGVVYKVTPAARTFISFFDQGQFPELVLPRSQAAELIEDSQIHHVTAV